MLSFTLFGLLLAGCISVLLFVGGLLVACIGGWALRQEFYVSKHGVIVPGTVIAVESRRKRTARGGHATIYEATVSFRMLDHDQSGTFVTSTGSFKVYRVDQQVRVIYLSANQQIVRIYDYRRWIGPCLGICFGLVFAALTVVFSIPVIIVHH